VVGEACAAAAGWPDQNAPVAVNLSGRDLDDDNLLTAISQAFIAAVSRRGG